MDFRIRKLVSEASSAKAEGKYSMAIQLSKEALELSGNKNSAALTVLVSSLRKKHLSKQALCYCEEFKGDDSFILLTTWAATLCDLEKYEESLMKVNRAYFLEPDISKAEYYTSNVYNRLKKEAPWLFDSRGKPIKAEKFGEPLKFGSFSAQRRIPKSETSLPKNKIKMMKRVEMYCFGKMTSFKKRTGSFSTLIRFKENEKVIRDSIQHTSQVQLEVRAIVEGLDKLKERCEIDVVTDSKYLHSLQDRLTPAMILSTGSSRGKGHYDEELWESFAELVEFHVVSISKVLTNDEEEILSKVSELHGYTDTKLNEEF